MTALHARKKEKFTSEISFLQIYHQYIASARLNLTQNVIVLFFGQKRHRGATCPMYRPKQVRWATVSASDARGPYRNSPSKSTIPIEMYNYSSSIRRHEPATGQTLTSKKLSFGLFSFLLWPLYKVKTSISLQDEKKSRGIRVPSCNRVGESVDL